MRVSESFPLLKFIRSDKPFLVLSIVLIAFAFMAGVGTDESAAQSRERSLVLQELPLANDLQHNHRLLEQDQEGDFVLAFRDGERVCEVAPPAVAAALATRVVAVNRINHQPRGEDGITQQQPAPLSGLRVVLRGTQQLEEFPQAKQAFLRAAATWERIIESPISIVVDVDFGPKNFDVPFPSPNIIGSTRSQIVGGNDIYDDVRTELAAHAQSPAQASVIRRLPADRLPTDLGTRAGVVAPTAVFRALGLIAPIADPDGEEDDFGKPPAIGFNSAIKFDFNAADGIDADKLDFEASALHEIGHALGFYSSVGVSSSVRPSVWDFFRLRPDTDMAAFGTAERILTAGGMQAFLAGREPLPLSTGNPQATNGDRRQASHWKDDQLNNGNYIGIMDPTGSAGDHDEITENDLYALATMGHRIRSIDSVPTTELLADDGGLDTGVAGAGVIIVNRLTPSSYPARLEAIKINFAQFKDLPDPSGAAIRLVAFAGAPGATSPSSSPVLLVDQPEPLPKITNAGFVEFKIKNGPVLNEGDFYVGFQAPEPAGGVVFSLDDDEPKNGRSFYSVNNGTTYRGLTIGTPPVTYNAMMRALVSVERGARVENAIGRPGETVDVPITLLSKGSERSAAFTLDFDPAVMTVEGIESGESSITLQTAGAGTSGHFGVTAFVPENQTFASGRRRLAVARFRINAGAPVSVSSITLGNQPTVRRILGPGNTDLTDSAIFTGGKVSIAGKVVGASAASYITDVLAPGSLVVGFGTKLSVEEAASNTVPLPHVLVGTTVRIRDRENREFLSQLFYVSSAQVNFLLPAALALGPATIEISSLDGNVSIGLIQVEKIAPGLFSANSTGRDIAAGNIVRVRNGQQTTEPFARFESGGFVPIPIDHGPDGDAIYLVFYGTGIRNRDPNGNVSVTVGGVRVDVTYAGSSPPYVGLDQVNTGPIPRSLAGRGEVEVVLNVEGKEANRLKVVFK